jgi:mRNA interferase MazF
MNESVLEIFKIMDWMKVQSRLQLSTAPVSPHVKEIWWASLGQNIGVEIHGKNPRFERPVIIIKVFNLDSFLVIPLTSTLQEDDFTSMIKDNLGNNASARLSQIRTISIKRFLRKMSEIEDNCFDEVLEKLSDLIFNTKLL